MEDGETTLTSEIRHSACELLQAHPFPSLTDSSIRSLRLLTPLSTLPPLPYPEASDASHLANPLPTHILDHLARNDTTSLLSPKSNDSSTDNFGHAQRSYSSTPAGNGAVAVRVSGNASSSHQRGGAFDAMSFFDGFLRDTLKPVMDLDESEPSDSDVDLSSPSLLSGHHKSASLRKSSTKSRDRKTNVAGETIALIHCLLRSSQDRADEDTGFMMATPSLKRLAKLLQELARDGKGPLIWTPHQSDGGGAGRLSVTQLARVLKFLHQSVQRASSVQPVPLDKSRPFADVKTPTAVKSKPKAAASKKRKKSTSKNGNNDEDEGSPQLKKSRSSRSRSRSASTSALTESEDESEGKAKPAKAASAWTTIHPETLAQDLDTVLNGSAAAGAILALLSVDKLPKKLYMEEIIEDCLVLIKTRLSSLIYPLAEWSAATAEQRTHPLQQAFEMSASATRSAQELLKLFPTLMSRISALLQTEDMQEQILITSIYAAIGPFFVDLNSEESVSRNRGKAKKTDDLGSTGSHALKALRMSALGVIRTIYSKYNDQRKWIVEEILTSLTQVPDLKKKTFVMRNGRVIHTVSALLLHLVQSTADTMISHVQDKFGRLESGAMHDDEEDSVQQAQRHICQVEVGSATDSADAAAGLIVGFLLKKTKSGARNSAELDYRIVLENVVNDFLAVFDLEEWPAAQFMINVCTTRFFNVLAGSESTASASTLKSACLDHICAISSHLFARKQTVFQNLPLKSLPQLLLDRDLFEENFKQLAAARHDLIGALAITHDEEGTHQSAAAFASMLWASDLLKGLDKMDSLVEDGVLDAAEVTLLQKALLAEVETLWSLKQQFDSRRMASQLDLDANQICLLAKSLAWSSGQAELSEILVKRVLKVLEESSTAAHRSKALKCLEAIVAEEPDIFALEEVREAVEERFKDAQASVRDAAFDLLGKYIMLRPNLARDYLPHILERTNDKGHNVRKRAVKLLGRIFTVVDDPSSRTEILSKLLWRVRDDDSSIKDLAIAVLNQLVFEPNSKGRESIADVADILVHVANNSERMPPLEDALKQIIDANIADTLATERISERLRAIASVVVDYLVDPEEAKNEERMGCATLLETLAHTDQKLISPAQLRTLLPLLTNSPDSHERVLRDSLLRALLVLIPHFPASSLPIFQVLQGKLTRLLTSTPVLSYLQIIVPCLCATICHQTKDYTQLCKIFTAMQRKLDYTMRTIREDPENLELQKSQYAALSTLIWSVALLCEHADFDALRETEPAAQEAVDSITEDDVASEVFVKLVDIYACPSLAFVRHNALLGMGCIFRAHPSFMVDSEATIIMDEIFAIGEEHQDSRLRLLHVIQDFLSRQAAIAEHELKESGRPQTAGTAVKHNEGLDLNDLIGDTDRFADSGVASAVVQRHLSSILAAAQSDYAPARNAAFEIIGFTVRQGLAHPLTTLPTIVAIESCPDPLIAKRAFALHSILHEKHSGLIHSQFLECARVAFRYQQRFSESDLPPRGYVLGEDRPVALFALWHSLVKEKRPKRREFFRALVKGLPSDPTLPCSKDDVDLARFLCDNLATIDYKVQEDIFFVVRACDRILAESAMQTIELLQERLTNRCKIEEDEEGAALPIANVPSDFPEDISLPDLVHTSMCLSFVFLLRRHLKHLYGLSDAKCAKFIDGRKSTMGDKVPLQNPQLAVTLNLHDYPLLQPTSSPLSPLQFVEQSEFFTELLSDDVVSAGTVDEDEEEDESDDLF